MEAIARSGGLVVVAAISTGRRDSSCRGDGGAILVLSGHCGETITVFWQ